MTLLRTPGRRAGLFAGLALAALAQAAAAQDPHPVSLSAGPLDTALLQLAAQTHEQLLFTQDLVAGRRSPALKGQLTAEQALARLLADTNITVTRAGPGVLVLRPAPTRTLTAQPATPAAPQETASRRPFGQSSAESAGDSPLPAALPLHPPAPTRPTVEVDAVVVVGSHIRGAQDGSSQVLVLDRNALDSSGYTNLAGAVEALPQNFSGTGSEGTVALGTDGTGTNSLFSSGVNLRGLGANATLVLIDGRRLAGTGVQSDFADLSTIPTAAVSRVEVLLDGGSALYGSDAVGGVVNIVLRHDLDGGETRISGGDATQGAASEFLVSQTLGKTWSTGHVLLTYEHRDRGALAAADRDVSRSADLRRFGGTDHRVFFSVPGNILVAAPTGGTVPGFAIPTGQNGVGLLPSQFIAGTENLAEPRAGADILPHQVTDSAYFSAAQDLGERIQLSTDISYGRRRFDYRAPASTASITVTRANPFFVSPIGAASEQIAYSFAKDLPQTVERGDTETFSASVGAQVGLSPNWRADVYGAFAQDIGRTRGDHLLNATALAEATGQLADQAATPFSTASNGFFNPFGSGGANNAAVLAFIGEGFTTTYTRDRVSSLNLKADGPVFDGPAGPILAAVGADLRYEQYLRTGVNFVSGFAPTNAAPIQAARTVSAVFGELRVPLLSAADASDPPRLSLSLAGRVEHYDDFGASANPKVGIIWSPVADLRLRASYGTSFRAPALRELNAAPLFTPSLLPLGSTRVLSLLLTGGNAALKPETATTWSAGVDYAPAAVPGLKLSATWFDTNFRNRIGQPARANNTTTLSDPSLASFVDLISPSTNPTDRAKIAALLANPATNTGQGVFPPESYGAIVDERFVNTATLHVSGIDAQVTYSRQFGADRLGLSANGAYLGAYDQQVTPTSRTINEANIANFPLKLRARGTAEWTHGIYSAQLALNYTGAYHDALGVQIGDLLTTDLQLSARPADGSPLAGFVASLSVRNLFDRDPPFYNAPVGVAYDPANADLIGRFVALQLTKRW